MPSYLPAAFVNLPETIEPHVGVQIRKVESGVVQNRNSDPIWMLETAHAIAAHLNLPVIVYGHPGGCELPDGARLTWRGGDGRGHLGRELGYLRQCRIMLAPDSGWADLMGWLRVPTFLEQLFVPDAFEGMRGCFRPRLALYDRNASLAAQTDALLAADVLLPPCGRDASAALRSTFPWEP